MRTFDAPRNLCVRQDRCYNIHLVDEENKTGPAAQQMSHVRALNGVARTQTLVWSPHSLSLPLSWNRINVWSEILFSFCTCWTNIDILTGEMKGHPLLFAYCNRLQNYWIDLLKKAATCLPYSTAFRKVGYMTFTKCCRTISCHLNYSEEITFKKENKQKTKIFSDFLRTER